MKLEWEKNAAFWEAQTPFDMQYSVGESTIEMEYGPVKRAFWFCQEGGITTREEFCDSIEDGKTRCEADWQERIAPIIAPYKLANSAAFNFEEGREIVEKTLAQLDQPIEEILDLLKKGNRQDR